MQVVAVTRIMNEDDIVEAFVRHHRPEVDHHLFLDNGSVDRTLEILKSLQDEGMPLTVLQNRASFYAEVQYNTALFNIAAKNLGADWVVFLDTDEFVDARKAPEGLRHHLERLLNEVLCIGVSSVGYFDTKMDDADDLLVPRRMRWRNTVIDQDNMKMFVRGALSGFAEIEGGQHTVSINGQTLPANRDETLILAHYYRRGPHQVLWKNLQGRLKVLAGGRREVEKQRNAHYVSVFETMRDGPEALLRDPNWMAPSYSWESMMDDPIQYGGATLRYTTPMDGAMKAIRIMLNYAEQLAMDFGELLDTNEGLRLQMEKKAATWTKLF
jgi:hypothetical protein